RTRGSEGTGPSRRADPRLGLIEQIAEDRLAVLRHARDDGHWEIADRMEKQLQPKVSPNGIWMPQKRPSSRSSKPPPCGRRVRPLQKSDSPPTGWGLLPPPSGGRSAKRQTGCGHMQRSHPTGATRSDPFFSPNAPPWDLIIPSSLKEKAKTSEAAA